MLRRLLAAAALAGLAIVVAGGLYAAAFAFQASSAEYGLHRGADARAWSLRPAAFAGSSTCAACHAPEATRLASARHAIIGCSSCHGPLEAHAGVSSPDSTTVAVKVPGPELCLRCHVTGAARPSFQPQITPADHYTDACLDCHDPHSGVANRPPVVSHPLDELPACIVCHGPDGFRARSIRHPVESTEDAVCLSCHALGRGEVDVTAGDRP